MYRSEIDTHHTLGSLVSKQIDRARVFEWFGLDYCCGGGKTLIEACSEKGIDPIKVTQELLKSDEISARSDTRNWNSLPVNDLIEDIVSTHHSYLKMELPRLTYLTEKIAAVHGERHPSLLEVRKAYAELRTDLEAHMKEEEDSLFPTLRLLNSGGDFSMLKNDANGTIRKMEAEHVIVGSMLSRLALLTDGYKLPADGCETYRVALHGLMTLEQDTHLHVHKENNILFPKALGAAV